MPRCPITSYNCSNTHSIYCLYFVFVSQFFKCLENTKCIDSSHSSTRDDKDKFWLFVDYCIDNVLWESAHFYNKKYKVGWCPRITIAIGCFFARGLFCV